MMERECERLGIEVDIERVTHGRGGVAKDKGSALDAITPMIKRGSVKFRKTQIDGIDELLAFPNSSHDDMVDALTYCLDAMRYQWEDKMRQYAQRYNKAEDQCQPAIPELGM